MSNVQDLIKRFGGASKPQQPTSINPLDQLTRSNEEGKPIFQSPASIPSNQPEQRRPLVEKDAQKTAPEKPVPELFGEKATKESVGDQVPKPLIIEKDIKEPIPEKDVKKLEEETKSQRKETKPEKKVKFASSSPQTRFRTTFEQGERLLENKSMTIEYRNYFWPFGDQQNQRITWIINSFINRKGGRIYIGVTNDCIVKGVKLSRKEKDEFRKNLSLQVKYFDPPIWNEQFIKTDFIGITDPSRNGNAIPDLFVIKIIVKQGDPSLLYSISGQKFESYIRNDHQTLPLSTRQIREYTIRRQAQPEEKIQDTEFKDPEPAQLIYENQAPVDRNSSSYKAKSSTRPHQSLKDPKPIQLMNENQTPADKNDSSDKARSSSPFHENRAEENFNAPA